MLRSLKITLLAAFFLAAFAGPVLAPALVSAADVEVNKNLCGGANLKFTSGGDDRSCKANNPEKKLNGLIEAIINIFSIVVGVAAVIMIIYGGFRYVTSGGDSGNITTAKNSIIYALVGLLFVVFAQVIVKFVLTKITT